MLKIESETLKIVSEPCYHCGSACDENPVFYDRKAFCCYGCSQVYSLLSENQLCDYYCFDQSPGKKEIEKEGSGTEYLNNVEIVNSLLDFNTPNLAKVNFFIPYMHCASCIWLLENLTRLHAGVLVSRVDFLKKQVAISFRPQSISLRELVELLKGIGYEPLIDLGKTLSKKEHGGSRSLLTKLGVAGFCAGNIMLFSFPDYLGLDDPMYKQLFGYLNLVLSIPVVFYSGSEYFSSVRKSLSERKINIDVPILLAILTAYLRSTWEVLSETGTGYFDSLTGLIFLLLAGKWFQQKSFDFLSFDRDVNAYFPLSVCRLSKGVEEYISIESLQKGDKIKVRKNELVPADCLLYQGIAELDNSFITGESEPETKKPGELLFAGARQKGGAIEAEVVRVAKKSYLTQLWNEATYLKTRNSDIHTFTDAVGTWFTPAVLALAFGVAIYWWPISVEKSLNAFTATLIIACPCALAISYPFAVGHAMGWLAKLGFYLKNADVVERISQSKAAVFDKTGTLTNPGCRGVKFIGLELSLFQWDAIVSLCAQSTHPLSRKIVRAFPKCNQSKPIEEFQEITGQGVEGIVDGYIVRCGSAEFVGAVAVANGSHARVYAHIGGVQVGYFDMEAGFRPGLSKLLQSLKKSMQEIWLLSGDHPAEKKVLQDIFSGWTGMVFEQKPEQKMQQIQHLSQLNLRPIMFGDGLNDAAALKVAHVGVAITDDTLTFSPSSDVIVEGKNLVHIPAVLDFCKGTMRTIRISFAVSLIYNCVGLSFALSGTLSPLIAAILMPISSISMMLAAAVGTWWYGRKFGL